MKNKYLIFSLFLLLFNLNAFGQSGGVFAVTQSVIASGGQQTTGGIFALDGTIGQSTAGENSANGIFDVHGGFWLPGFAPSASMVSIGYPFGEFA